MARARAAAFARELGILHALQVGLIDAQALCVLDQDRALDQVIVVSPHDVIAPFAHVENARAVLCTNLSHDHAARVVASDEVALAGRELDLPATTAELARPREHQPPLAT